MPYYTVLQGHNPGVYASWSACQKEITGFHNALFRKFDSSEEALKFLAKGGKVENVFVDGACRGNGRSSRPEAGYGVYYGPGDDRNAAIPLDAAIKPTNQRAELMGLIHALRNVYQELMHETARRPTRILSDSQYSVRSFNEWSDKWRRNGWTNVKGETIANATLIQELVNLKDRINSQYSSKGWSNIVAEHVEGHAGNLANEEADRLANLGAD
ncbi:uncharacterized protein J8A68_000055 [[Candida] subhashii]|uniref:Ribonuclease H n=1 Tax=[Candida] subhashii TaxID=561895 RepID=A0A8J5R7Z2_9ASCO|nr:uncharacterized protein J8A68_000055 [[Candida] subhashii]KAG7666400.1 hypothetical protein J8A68_000055 [[Candida] subhashii]